MKTLTNHGAEIVFALTENGAVAKQQACSAYEWTIDDVWAGRLICKPPGPSRVSGWFASWCYKIGWHTSSTTSKDRYTMIAMSDGMIHAPRTKEAIVEWLKLEEMVPMREEWWRDACRCMRYTLGFVQDAPDDGHMKI